MGLSCLSRAVTCWPEIAPATFVFKTNLKQEVLLLPLFCFTHIFDQVGPWLSWILVNCLVIWLLISVSNFPNSSLFLFLRLWFWPTTCLKCILNIKPAERCRNNLSLFLWLYALTNGCTPTFERSSISQIRHDKIITRKSANKNKVIEKNIYCHTLFHSNPRQNLATVFKKDSELLIVVPKW